jgi:Asp-tRNA(Asn)/Glu-tRNA(Gln) amidotransferase A subunit family amidase
MLAPEEKLKLATKPYLIVTARFANGADTPRDFLERCLADLTALEPKIGAFVHLNLEGARAAADQSTRRWREGRQSSPIDGMPLGIKDIIETADMPTENGSPLFAGWRSERDGASVAALGTQVIGSTIRPASYCGCIGFKASVGALNRGGSYDGLSQSATGVLAATLEDAWQVAYEIAVRAGGDPGYPGLVRVDQHSGAAQAAPPCLSRDGGVGRRIARRKGSDGRCIGADQIRWHRAHNEADA